MRSVASLPYSSMTSAGQGSLAAARPSLARMPPKPGGYGILSEQDFSKAKPNPYASRYAAGSSVVVLEPNVAAAFPTSGEANDALRALAAIIQKHRTRERRIRRSS